MSNIEIPLSSAVINLINIVILQLVLAPIVAQITSTFAGFDNFKRQNVNEPLKLKSFDAPVVGENLVMSKGFKRRLMIGIRVSVVLAIGISNVGLEGRSRTRKVVQKGEIFGPGIISRTETNSTRVRDRLIPYVTCNRVLEDGRTHRFGSVINGTCHRDVDEFAYIRLLKSDKEEFNISINACDTLTQENRTVYKCRDAEFVCRKESSDENCVALRYGEDGKTAWECESGLIVDGSQAKLRDCRRLTVRREYLQWWRDALVRFELNGMVAVFASVYGEARQEEFEVEDGKEEVTIVTLLWMLPAGWIVLLVLISMGWIVWKKSNHAHAVAHDERHLFRLVDKRAVITDDNECLVIYD